MQENKMNIPICQKYTSPFSVCISERKGRNPNTGCNIGGSTLLENPSSAEQLQVSFIICSSALFVSDESLHDFTHLRNVMP